MDTNRSPVEASDNNDAVSIPVTVSAANKPATTAPLPVTPSVASAPVLPPEEVEEVDQKAVEESPVVEAIASQMSEPSLTSAEVPAPTIKDDMPVAKPMGRSLQELAAEEDARNNPAAPEVPVESPEPNKPKSKKSPIVFVAALLVLALVGGGVFAYWQSSNKTTPTASTNNTTQTEKKVNADDINKVSTDLDTSLKKIDDTKDFSTTDLADAALGL